MNSVTPESAGSSRRRRRLSTAIKESLRELSGILIDMIEEYARHVGQADLIRESVDGLTGEDPPG